MYFYTTHAELLHAYEVAAKKRDLWVLSSMVVTLLDVHEPIGMVVEKRYKPTDYSVARNSI